ncbi:Holliday junction resolvase RuvX [Corynebacterium lactis]|uniref:Putative pre-16S rRNA nuclease n=1 Tax=Corynebacterium lactis RW2-5 TaxID=1408189 RepID=A0A0K2H0W0_9CORY|nr:Holliday junction resolvase RuvX [Corynebacterium lactis]ALA67341.1 Holliday junction resolvase [Corynebacterium lactis RW2-5]
MARLALDAPGIDDPGRGRRLGIDVGDVRVGVAVSDPDGILATPVETVARATRRKDPDGPDIDRLVELAQEYEVVEIVVGLPIMLDGSFGSSARKAGDVGFRLKRRLGDAVAVRYADERMTTVLAQSRLHDAGIDVRSGRKVIDQAAAVEILQAWLDNRKKYLAEQTDSE